jgi:hypothetical protein
LTAETASKRSLNAKLWLALGLLATFVVTALLMRLEGRLWICACGSVRFWISNTCSSDNSQHFLDPYAFTHVLHGFAFYWLVALVVPRLRGPRAGNPRGVGVKSNWQLLIAMALEAAWEVFENTNFVIERYRSVTAALGYTGDTVVNSFGDILCCLVGFLIAQLLGFRRAVVAFLALELVLILWIRDSLLLEILMLTFPIDAIKAWQLCP